MLYPTLRRGALALGAAVAVVAGSSAFPQPTVLDARFDYRFDTSNGSLNLYFNINDLLDSEPEEFYGRVQLERSGRHRPQRDG